MLAPKATKLRFLLPKNSLNRIVSQNRSNFAHKIETFVCRKAAKNNFARYINNLNTHETAKLECQANRILFCKQK